MNKMWMMGYNDGGEFNLGDSFNGAAAARKLRPLLPRPLPTATSANCNNNNGISSMSDIQCLSRIHGTHDLFALNHHLAIAEQSKREFNAQQVVVSSRWNPTPEQLETLEELYRRGTRTPNADEIQHITAQLRRYGKIEGKNVFYWFQNHKARERQKRRRQSENVSERKDSGGGGVNKTGTYEVEQTKNWGNPTNCMTSTFSEKNVWIEEAAKAECRGTELGWLHFEEADQLQQQQQHHHSTTISNLAERNATWYIINNNLSSSNSSSPYSSSPPPPPPPPTTTNNHLMTNPCYTISPTSTIITSSTTSPSTVRLPPFTTSHGPYSTLFIKSQDRSSTRHVVESHETLQLFPLGSCGSDGNGENGAKVAEMGFPASGNNHHHHLGSRPFFEFLPLKN